MNRRSAIALLVATALLTPTSAWAQGNGKGNDNEGGNGNTGNGNADGHDDSNADGNGNGDAHGHDKGNDGRVDSKDNGEGKGQSQGNNAGALASPAAAVDNAEFSESEVLAAVQAGSAVSLETLLPDIRTRTGGEIINAKLQEARGFLLYAVTVLTPGGIVVTEYYYARSGIHVGS